MQPYFPPHVEEYFAPLSRGLNELSEKWGVQIEKYNHDSPSWSFCFGHPMGGQAKIDITATAEDEVNVQAVWWMDENKTFTRSLRWGPKAKAPREPEPVSAAVEKAFAEVLSWKLGAWSQVAEGYEPYWSSFVGEEFLKFSNPWPLPRKLSDA